MSHQLYCLRNVDLYASISERELIRLSEDAIEGYFAVSEVLYSPEKPPEHMYVLKEGEVELFKIVDGKKIVVETLLPGDVFGDFGVSDIPSHTAVVVKRAYVCRTPTHEFLHIVKHHPEIALRLIQVFAARTQEYEDRIASLYKPAKERLFDELVSLQKKHDTSIWGKMFRIPLQLSHQRLADKTGLNRVTVTKLINELKNEGRIIIEKDSSAIRIITD